VFILYLILFKNFILLDKLFVTVKNANKTVNGSSFDANWMMIATWYQVSLYGNTNFEKVRVNFLECKNYLNLNN